MANSADPDHTLLSVVSDQGLHYLHRTVCPYTKSIYGVSDGYFYSCEKCCKQSIADKFNWTVKKTCLYNVYPLKPHFYIAKQGFTGIYIIFLISAQNIDCGYSLEPPRRGGSKEYPQSMFWAEIWKTSEFLSENFQFLVVKFSIYLNRRVFVM